jgi:hypothetical protein
MPPPIGLRLGYDPILGAPELMRVSNWPMALLAAVPELRRITRQAPDDPAHLR